MKGRVMPGIIEEVCAIDVTSRSLLVLQLATQYMAVDRSLSTTPDRDTIGYLVALSGWVKPTTTMHSYNRMCHDVVIVVQCKILGLL